MKNKSFWISLLVFILLMCSCKTKKLDSNVQIRNEVQTEVSHLTEETKVDTTKTTYSEQLRENKVIKETIIEEVYDKDSGNLTKKTTTEREVAQDSNKVSTQEEQRAVIESSTDSLNHFRETTQKVESEIKEESIGGQESFGKWFGLTLGLVIGLIIIYLLQKLRIN